MASGARSPFPAPRHDHEACVASALGRAAALCGARGAKLTERRRQVLELVWRGHEPVGAYDILEQLQDENGRAAPPTVYRALDFLMEQGLVHRIETLNAYVGCAHPGEAHVGQFLICTGCGATAELGDPAIAQSVMRRAGALGFSVERQTIELRGRCPACREAG